MSAQDSLECLPARHMSLKLVNAPGCRLRMEKAAMSFNAGSSTALTTRRIYIHMYTYLNNYMYIFEIQLIMSQAYLT